MVVDASAAPQVIEHASLALGLTPFDARWLPFSARITLCGQRPNGAGILRQYRFTDGSLQVSGEVETDAGLKCSTFGASPSDGRQLATGDFAGRVSIWDMERVAGGSRPTWTISKAHNGLVNCIDGVGGLDRGYGAPELTTGGRDGIVRIWDPRQKDPVAAIAPVKSAAARECWTVAFGGAYDDAERSVAAGYDNGDVKLLDLRTNKIRWETNLKNGVVSMQFDRAEIPMNKLVVTTLESRFRVYDMRTFNSDVGYAFLSEKAHDSTVWLVRHLPQNRDLFATGGGNGTLYLWRYMYPGRRQVKTDDGRDQGVAGTLTCLNKRRISDQPLVSLDWSADKLGLGVVTALDQTLKILIVTKMNRF